MKKKYLFFAVMAAGLTGLTGCSKFDEMNTSSTGLSKENIPPAHSFARMLYRGILYDYQRNMNLYDDLYAYYFADNTTWWTGINYAYNDGWAGCMWNRFYTESLPLYYSVKDYCTNDKDSTIIPTYKRMQAINDVGCVYLWSRLTDRFGDVPYFGAGLGDTVSFTPQEEIYADLLKRLDEDSDALKDEVAGEYVPGSSYDLMYGGDYNKWRKFANSLMLRLATRISKVQPVEAKQYVELAIQKGCFESIDDVCLEPFDPTCFGDYYDRTSWDWGQTAPDYNFVSLLNGTNPGYPGSQDPRLRIFFLPAHDSIYADQYVGFPHGNAATKDDYGLWKQGLVNGKYTKNTFSVLNEDNVDGYFYNANHTQAMTNLKYPVMTYSEVLFCMAEAALRGWNVGSVSAAQYYEDGIRASIREAAAHTAQCGAGLALVDESEIYVYIAEHTYPSAGTKEEQMRQIMIQKWIALYPNSTEAWCESRRTGYPDMVSKLVNYPGVIASSLVEDGNIVQRISYPDNVYNYECENIPEDYRPGGSKNRYRMQYGMFWSQAGKDGTYSKDATPSNF